VAILVTDGSDAELLSAIVGEVEAENATIQLVAPAVGGVTTSDGNHQDVDHALEGAPSAVFDAVIVASSVDGTEELLKLAAAVDWIRMAYAHLKAVGFVEDAKPLFDAAQVPTEGDDGVMEVSAKRIADFIDAAKRHRIWERESKVR
jgi:catalase